MPQAPNPWFSQTYRFTYETNNQTPFCQMNSSRDRCVYLNSAGGTAGENAGKSLYCFMEKNDYFLTHVYAV